MFDGFREDAFSFLKELRENNNEAFYRENKERYQRVLREPLKALCEEAAPTAAWVDEKLDTRPGSAMSRLRRDTRFTNDKTPFRDHVWIGWRYPGERRSEGFHMYWGFGIDWYSWGCGSYGTDKPLMDALRAEIIKNPERVRNALSPLLAAGYCMSGEPYVRFTVPDSVPGDLSELWRMRFFGLESDAPPEARSELYSHAAAERLIAELRRMAPLLRLMRDLRHNPVQLTLPEKKENRPRAVRARRAEEFEF